MNTVRTLALATTIAVGLSLGACTRSAAPGSNTPDDHTHTEGDGHDHGPEGGDDHGHEDGPTIALGEAAAGAFTIRASRDAGEVAPGGDCPIDAWVTGGNVTAVRFWIGTQDAAGSIKARAEIENPADPTRWHTHTEVPSPLPAGAMLWVEVEDAAGATFAASFALQP